MKYTSLEHRPPPRVASARASRWAMRAAALAISVVAPGCGAEQHLATSTADQSIATGGAATASSTYAIRMHRDATVGRRGRLLARGETRRERQIRSSGEIVQEQHEDIRARFGAVERVVSVDDHGKASQSDYTIERFELDGERGAEALLSAGQVLTVVRGARGAQATVDGQAVAAPVRRALDVVLSMTASDVTDDDVFGTTERQAPGAHWAVHGDVAALDLARRYGVQSAISGSARLVQRTTFQDTDCLELSAEMNGTFTTFPRLPPGAVVKEGTSSWAFEAMLPISEATPVLSGDMRLRIHIVADFQADGQSRQMEMTVASERHDSFTPL